MRKSVLIVEDEAILYRRMRKILEKEYLSVFDYTPSYQKAIERIQNQRPDLVLLDIQLQGEQTGIDLGQRLSKEYQIPFIYITQFDDDHTFYSGLHTNHELFLVKTKPSLNSKEIIRAVHTILNKNKDTSDVSKEGIFGLVEYLREIRDAGESQIEKVPVEFKDVAFFTLDFFVNRNGKKEKLKPNYLWFLTKDKEYYFLYSSLKELQGKLPHYFVRINESYIVNISPDVLKGKIRSSEIVILNHQLRISPRYKEEVQKRMNLFYF